MKGCRGRALCGALVALLIAGAAAAENAEGSAEQTQLMVDRFAARFGQVGPQMGEHLDDLYTADVTFRDPVTTLSGIDHLRRYLGHFGQTANGARFAITDTVLQPGNAVVFWTMTPAAGASRSMASVICGCAIGSTTSATISISASSTIRCRC